MIIKIDSARYADLCTEWEHCPLHGRYGEAEPFPGVVCPFPMNMRCDETTPELWYEYLNPGEDVPTENEQEGGKLIPMDKCKEYAQECASGSSCPYAIYKESPLDPCKCPFSGACGV